MVGSSKGGSCARTSLEPVLRRAARRVPAQALGLPQNSPSMSGSTRLWRLDNAQPVEQLVWKVPRSAAAIASCRRRSPGNSSRAEPSNALDAVHEAGSVRRKGSRAPSPRLRLSRHSGDPAAGSRSLCGVGGSAAPTPGSRPASPPRSRYSAAAPVAATPDPPPPPPGSAPLTASACHPQALSRFPLPHPLLQSNSWAAITSRTMSAPRKHLWLYQENHTDIKTALALNENCQRFSLTNLSRRFRMARGRPTDLDLW